MSIYLLDTTLGKDRKGYKVSVGDKVAQLVLAPVVSGTFTEGVVANDTLRGANGFGSTGA
jgi:dUTP pyrophosphatase